MLKSAPSSLNIQFRSSTAIKLSTPERLTDLAEARSSNTIVNCFASARPRLLLADELEQGLHPQFQIQLAHLLAEVIARGNQVISCTQSPTLVLAIFSSVARARLKAEQVAIYSMKRDETGGTIAVRNQISDSGEIVDGWFEPYARAERQLLEEFLPRAEEPDAPAAS